MITSVYPYRVRALAGGKVLAESTAAVEQGLHDGAKTLAFPPHDVRPGVPVTPAGDDLVFVNVDGVALEVVDGGAALAYPVWGDARDLVDILDVRCIDTTAAHPDGSLRTRRFVSTVLDRPGHVEGSQMLAQSIVAAGRLFPGRRVISAHMAFVRVAEPQVPLEFVLTELSAGRVMSSLAVQVEQGGKVRAAGTILLDVTAPAIIAHQDPAPPCAGPAESPYYDMSVVGRELRVVDGAYDNDSSAPVGPPVIDAWVRFRDVPDDAALHTGLLTQFTGHVPIAAAMRPHAGIGQGRAHRDFSTGINAITIAVHEDVRADRWMRYHHRSTFAGSGMTHAECRVYDEAGTLLASFTVEAMVRPFPDEGGRRL